MFEKPKRANKLYNAKDLGQQIDDFENEIIDLTKERSKLKEELKNQPELAGLNESYYEREEMDKQLKVKISDKNALLNNIRFIHDCSTAEKYILMQVLKQIKNIKKCILVTGENVEDCFMMDQANIGVSIDPKLDMVRKSSQIQVKNITYLIEAMQYGRCITINIRKFMLYQSTIALNLAIFIGIGCFRFKEPPISPSTILWLNFIMDTMAGIIFGSELPDQSIPRILPKPTAEAEEEMIKNNPKYKKWKAYTTILDKTEPNDPKSPLFNEDMKWMLIGQTIYQQLILTMIFYYGELWFVMIHKNKFIDYHVDCHEGDQLTNLSGPARWAQEHFYCGKVEGPTQKNIAFSFVYETFIWMQFFNLTNCRRVFDYCSVPFKRVLNLFYFGF